MSFQREPAEADQHPFSDEEFLREFLVGLEPVTAAEPSSSPPAERDRP